MFVERHTKTRQKNLTAMSHCGHKKLWQWWDYLQADLLMLLWYKWEGL